MTDAATQAWTSLLDAFEQDLAQPEPEFAPWQPPAEPLPAALAGRAEDVLRRQQERIRRTREELDAVAEQLGALRQVPPPRPDAPVYLDVQA
ncbi:hypothetical protein ACFC1I_18545 [Microbacterium sp. NPDC056044]|uniref:hypothetical protein n=1 Tax=Microbacterium sp. NPDC056044 TaxID=3345690 RepID=UPI0035D66BDA